MKPPLSTVLITEGAASLRVPAPSPAAGRPLIGAISKRAVFYNPAMRLNRDTAVLALRTLQRRLGRRVTVCEPMCGTGVRGVRLALEAPEVEFAVLGDLSPSAVRLAEENATLNGVGDRVRVRLMDAHLLLSLHSHPRLRVDYVDLDPYGSPAPLLEPAVRACKDGGMIALTATDMAPLCGVNPRACLRKYGGLPLRTEYSHEAALRLLAGALVRAAARLGSAAAPVFGYALDHYVRLYAVMGRGAKGADRSLDAVGYLLHCFGCLNRRPVGARRLAEGGICDVCGSPMRVGGPMWLGELADEAFCGEMAAQLGEAEKVDERLRGLLNLVLGEVGLPPTFYNIDLHCSRAGIESQPTGMVLSTLLQAGFRAARTHLDPRGVRTDARAGEFAEILKGVAARRRAGRDVA